MTDTITELQDVCFQEMRADELKIGIDSLTVLITEFHERADNRPIWCNACNGVTIQPLTRTADGRLFTCPECGKVTIYLQVAR